MRLRLVHALSLLLIGVILAAVLAFGGMLAWNLRSGFHDYLAARDTERLEQFATLIAEHLERPGGRDLLASGAIGQRELLDEFAERQGIPPHPPLADRPASAAPRGPRGPPMGPPPPPPGAEGFVSRVSVYTPDGRLLFGVSQGPHDGDAIARPVTVDGKTVAWVRIRPVALVPDAVEAAFLRRQYLGIAVLAAGLLALGLLASRWLAGRVVHPLLDIQDATARIARGELGMRLHTTRSDEVGDLIRNVNSMAEGLERLEQARRRWIAEISHELRTPLTVLRGELDALADGVRPLDHEAVVSLREEALRLGARVDDLHLLAMADLNALPCDFQECDAVQLLTRVYQRFEQRAGGCGISLAIELPADGALPVYWDGQRMEQVLANVLDNSLRYTDAPGRIRLRLWRHGERVCLSVDDSKPAAPERDLERLFDPLYRAEAARGRHPGGSGLGLAICAAFVQAHAGRITAAPSSLGGLSILVDLPVAAGNSQ